MVKRVFAIIGIVLGSVAAFVGSVFGVMAAMGKFKTPVVYPTQLEFLNNDQVVIERVPFNTELDWDKQGEGVEPDIYTLTLKGTNSTEKHEVNKNNCFLWFDGNVGSNLITLCDEYGKPLEKDDKNYYKVKCNEPIHYMINKVDYATLQDGKVMLKARSVNEKCETLTPLTLWIDREIDKISINTQSELVEFDQKIAAGVGIPIEFNYNVVHEYALKPISKESAKEIELFYFAKGYSTDYLKVTLDEVANTASPLNQLFTYDEEKDVLVFEAKKAGTYTFYLGAFKTYEAKQIYNAAIDGLTLETPNHHQINFKLPNNEYAMAITTVTIDVKNIEIGEIAMTGGVVVLNLYSEQDYVSLNGISNVPGAKDNNLELVMKKNAGGESAIDNSRFNEATFEGITYASQDFDVEKLPVFENSDGENTVIATCNEQGTEITINEGAIVCQPKLTNIKIKGEGDGYYTIVDYVYTQGSDDEQVKYFCSNGMAAYDEENEVYKLIKTGTYLNFFVKQSKTVEGVTTEQYVQADAEKFDFYAEKDNNSWKLISKKMPILADDESLVLAVLVVNSFGESRVEKLFASISVSVEPMPFAYEIKQPETTLGVTFSENGEVYQETDFNDIVSITQGSYNAGLLFVEKSSDSTKPIIVDTVDKITFVKNGVTYVLVGYIEEIKDPETDEIVEYKFINKVRLNKNLTSLNNKCNLKLVQLKNGYKQSVNDIISNEVLKSVFKPQSQIQADEEKDYIVCNKNNICEIESICEDEIKIIGKYIANETLLSSNFKNTINDGVNAYYENTKGVLYISSINPDMIAKLYKFYAPDASAISSEFANNLKVDEVEVDKVENPTEIIITFSIFECLTDDSTPITWSLNLSKEIKLPEFKILDSTPKQIVLKSGDDKIIELSNSDQIEYSENYLKIKVDYNSTGKYIYNKYQMVIEENPFTIPQPFNSKLSENSETGFQDVEFKKNEHSITYTSLNPNVIKFNGSNVILCKQGTAIVAVKIHKTTQYLKVVVDAKGFELQTNLTIFNEQLTDEHKVENGAYRVNLSDKVKYIYDDGNATYEIAPRAQNNVHIQNVKVIHYGDDALSVESKGDYHSLITEEGKEILRIADDAEGWYFEKTNLHVTLTIQFNIETLNETKTITFTFSSVKDINLNSKWADKIIYAGTQVQLYGTDYALFGNATGFTFQGQIGKVVQPDDVVIDNETKKTILKVTEPVENYTICALLDGKVVHPFTGFKVKPNVVANLKSEELELTSNKSESLSNLFDLQKYKDKVYGADSNATYSSDNLTDLTDDEKNNIVLSIKGSNTNPTLSYSNGTLQIGAMTEINGETKRTIVVHYNSTVVQEYVVTIKNSLQAVEAGKLSYKALTNYNITELVTFNNSDYKLKSIEDTANSSKISFEVLEQGTKFRITSMIEEPSRIDLQLTYENVDDNTKVLTLPIKNVEIKPFAPKEKGSIIAWAGERFNVASGVFDDGVDVFNETVVGDLKYVISFAGIVDENKQTVNVYTQGDNEFDIIFNKINKNDQTIYLVYKVAYQIAGKQGEYNYEVEAKIVNPQQIAVQYPESEIKLTNSINLRFYDDAVAKEFEESIGQASLYNYEPVLVSNSSSIINFVNDSIKQMQRVKITRAEGYDEQKYDELYNEDVTIELVGYQPRSGMESYANKFRIDEFNKNAKNVIKMPQYTIGFNGMLVFKLTSISGNSVFYCMYACCPNVNSILSIENNLEIIDTTGDVFTGYPTGYQVNIGDETTYKDLISDLNIKDIFGHTLDAMTSIYLYNISSLSAENKVINSSGKVINFTDVSTENVINFTDVSDEYVYKDQEFNKITLGLTYADGSKTYTYGTLTIYVQPIGGFSVSGYDILHNKQVDTDPNPNLIYSLPNGEFNTRILASESKVDLLNVGNKEKICADVTTGFVVHDNTILQFDGVVEETLDNTGSDYIYKYFEFNNVKYIFNSDYETKKTTAEQEDEESYIERLEKDSYFSIDSDGQILGSSVIVKLNDGTGKLELERKISQDLTFKVQYCTDNDEIISIVKYTYQATTITSQAVINENTVHVGKFKEEDEEKGFITTIWIDDPANKVNGYTFKEFFKGTYSGKISYVVYDANKKEYNYDETSGEFKDNDGNSCGVTYDKDEQTFTFTQGVETKMFTIKFNYLDFSTPTTRTFTFNVVPGIEFKTASDSSLGINESNRQGTIEQGDEINYKSNIGSSISVKKEKIDDDLYKYTIGGRIIYTNSDSTLKLSFGDDYNYVVDGYSKKVLTKDNNNNSLPLKFNTEFTAEEEKVNFVHTIQPKKITMTIEAEAGGKSYEKSINFYLTVNTTYYGLKSTYLVKDASHENVEEGTAIRDTEKGASHENVVEGTTIGTPLHEYMFNMFNSTDSRVELIVGKDDEGNDVLKTGNVDLCNMGLNDPNNPNFVHFAIGAQFGAIGGQNTGSQTLTFSEGFGKNELASLTMSSLVMNDSSTITEPKLIEQYTFQIMIGDKADGLTYISSSAENPNIDSTKHVLASQTKDANGNVTHLAYSYNADNADKLYVIGKLIDLENIIKTDKDGNIISRPIFGLKVNDMPVTGPITIADDDDDFSFNNSELFDINAWQYQFTVGSGDTAIKYAITIDFNTQLVFLSVVVSDSGTFDDGVKTLTITSLTGVNGESAKIIDNLTIVVSSVDFVSIYEDMYDKSIYGSDEIYIAKKLTKAYAPDGSGNIVYDDLHLRSDFEDYFKDYKFELDENITKSYYEIDSIRYDIRRLRKIENESDDDQLKYFVLNNVGHDVEKVQTTFKVKYQLESGARIVIDEFKYMFTVKLNMQAVVNGAGLNSDTLGYSEDDTNLVLDLASDKDGDNTTFPIHIELKNTTEIPQKEVSSNNVTYHNVLYYSFYWVDDGTTYDEELIKISKVSIVDSFGKEVDDSWVKLDGKKLIFNKDFTGTIILELFNETQIGTYSFEWKINVHGIRNIKELTGFNDKTSNNGHAFSSFNKIKIANSASDNPETTLLVTSPDEFYKGVTITYQYDYVIYQDNDSLRNVSNKELFEEKDSDSYKQYQKAYKVNDPSSNDDNTCLCDVPVVPLSINSTEEYIVVYKMTISYLNPVSAPEEGGSSSYINSNNDDQGNAFVYYFAYRVTNEGFISVYNKANGESSSVVYVDGDDKKGLITVAGDEYTPAEKGEYLELFNFKQYANVNDGSTFTRYELEYCPDEQNNTQTIYKLTVGECSGENATGFTGEPKPYTTTDIIGTGFQIDTTHTYKYDNMQLKLVNGDNEKVVVSQFITVPYVAGQTMLESSFDDIVAYSNFIDMFKEQEINNRITIKFKKSEYDSEESGYESIPLVAIPGGGFGIKVSDYFKGVDGDTRFKNEYLADFVLVQNGVEIFTVSAYDKDDNIKGFKLTTVNKIKANSSYRLSEIFKRESYFEKDSLANFRVVGVGTPNALWTNKSSATYEIRKKEGGTEDETYGTITIPGVNSDITYTIKKVTYEDEDSLNSLYKLEETFYYIAEDSVIVPNYSKVSNEKSYFYFNYRGDVDFNLKESFKTWEMTNENAEHKYMLTPRDSVDSIDRCQIKTDNGYENFYVLEDGKKVWITGLQYDDNGTISISAEALHEYKRDNPSEFNYPTKYINVVIGDKNFACAVVFGLDEYVQIDVETDDLDTSITGLLDAGGLKIPAANGQYVDFTESKISSISYANDDEVIEKYKDTVISGAKYIQSTQGNSITLNSTAITADVSADNSVVIFLKLTTTDETTMIVKLVVKKSEPSQTN